MPLLGLKLINVTFAFADGVIAVANEASIMLRTKSASVTLANPSFKFVRYLGNNSLSSYIKRHSPQI